MKNVPQTVVGIALLTLAGCMTEPKPGFDLASREMIDLSHPFNDMTLYWPTSPSSFALQTLTAGQTPGG